ncbi:MAG TPA: serine/threonine-protein kinase, partial [Salinibacter sp.]|nr:serine/threonine-protein kinase [Salinibacter sp.]
MSDAVIGTEVDGYRIQSVLGRGGMGTVYKAEDVNLSRTVAIKRINPGQQERESFIHRFRSEAQALARIDSSYIVGVYALRDTDIGLLIVMEYVEGGTLKDPLDRQGALNPNQAIPILEQTLQAFADAHSAGVIHRDIKPENVMLTQDGTVKVTDFGIAKLRQPDSGETVTQGGQGGTLKYMSPEQISSIDDVDARSDVYSLGMTAYEILAGDLPFTETDTDFDIMRKVVEGKIPPPDELNPDIPSGLAQWIVGAIQKEQDDRYQSAEEMRQALHEADQQTGEKTVTQPEWEVEGDTDVDETQTSVPGTEDRTQTVVPGGDDEDGVADSGGQTVMGPDMGGATQPAVPDPSEEQEAPAEAAATEASDEEETNWALVGGGAVGVLLLLVGGYVAFTQLGGSSGASATLSLTTAPEGALVLVNGDTAGTTPINRYALDAGPVRLEVRKEGYSPLDTSVTAEAGGRVQLQGITLSEASSGETASGATLAENTDSSPSDQPATTADTEPTEPAADPPSSTETGSEEGAESTTDNQAASGSGASETTRTETAATASNAATGIV